MDIVVTSKFVKLGIKKATHLGRPRIRMNTVLVSGGAPRSEGGMATGLAREHGHAQLSSGPVGEDRSRAVVDVVEVAHKS